MLKRDKVDKLYSLAVKRYLEEYPNKPLDEKLLDGIWDSIYKVFNSDGEKAAKNYEQNEKLW